MNEVVIIGTGPAGLTAGVYAARANLHPVIYAGLQHGGQLTTTTEVENFPGFSHGIMGPELMNQMTAQAERVGAKIIYDEITRVDFSGSPFKLWASDDRPILTKTVIIATGAKAKTLHLPNEAKLMGRGLSTCATCDGFFFKGKPVAVTGGGDSAMEEASYLSKICSEVFLIHRSDNFRASPIMLERAKANPKIKFLTFTVVEEALANEQGVYQLRLKNLKNNSISTIDVPALFMAIGHTPNTAIFKNILDMDQNGYLLVHDFTKTKIPGVFAAGDVSDHVFRQAITAAGMGCQAAIQAQRYLESL